MGGDVWEEHLWEAAAAEVQIGIPGSDMDKEADASGAEVAQTLEGASPEDQAIFSADSVEGKVSWIPICNPLLLWGVRVPHL